MHPLAGARVHVGRVLMPCRALEAFGPPASLASGQRLDGLNALSGIGGVRTDPAPQLPQSCIDIVLMPCRALEAFGRDLVYEWPVDVLHVLMPCRALEAFGLTHRPLPDVRGHAVGLNALSGIGGVRTTARAVRDDLQWDYVLMPCRALEAFGPTNPGLPQVQREVFGLNALSGIGGVRTTFATAWLDNGGDVGLNALSGIGGVRTDVVLVAKVDASDSLNALSGIGGVRTELTNAATTLVQLS